MTDKTEEAPAKGYIGSVRFFKNLIFLSICVLIAIPSALAVKYYRIVSTAQEPPVYEAVPAFIPATEPVEPNEEAVIKDTADAVSENPPAYQSLYPDFYAPQPYAVTERIERSVYLTFDDGPSEQTEHILDILAEKDVKATFFVVGQDDETGLARLREIAAQGHTLGMHTYSHVYTEVYASVENCLAEFYANFTQIRDATGVAPTVFRFPGGSINAYSVGFYQELIAEMTRRGFVPFDWNVSAEDNGGPQKTADEIVELVQNRMRGVSRGVVLLHDKDGSEETVAALPALIDRLRANGYTFYAITPETMPVLFS